MCDERERLIGYVYGECDADDRRAVDEHLDDCDVCRSEIRALRRTREDLLAWDVPEHGSVWTPFAPPAPVAWYKQVPAWAAAAAAGVVMMAGAAGGAVTHAWLASPAGTTTSVAAVEPGRQAVPVSLSDDQWADVERRVLDLMRRHVDDRLSAETSALAASNAAVVRTASNAGVGLDQLRGLQTSQEAFEGRVVNWLLSLTNEVGGLSQRVADEHQKLNTKIDFVASASPRGPSER